MEGSIDLLVEDGIAALHFFHPAHNSLPSYLLQELEAALLQIADNPAVRVVVLASGGERTFCAGASFDELLAIRTREEGLAFFSGFARVINAMRRCPQLIIARVQGKAIGGGVGLAAAADYALASAAASIKLSELAVGIGPFVIGPAVERKMGLAAFSQLAIDATSWRSAEWAAQHGLFAEVLPDVAALDAAVAQLASTLAQSSPAAMQRLKSTLWAGTDHWDGLLLERAAISGELVLSDFAQKAIEAFKAKK